MKWVDWLREHDFEQLFAAGKGKDLPFGNLVWRPGKPDRDAAWSFYTELRTRIATQPLAYRAGDEAAALDSIYKLFELSRSVIKQHQGCTHFATLTVRLLNTEVRPFTAKWHRIKMDGRLSSADVRFDFRRELGSLQPVLRQFTRLLALLAEDNTLSASEDYEVASEDQPAKLWDPLPFGIDPTTIDPKEAAKIDEKEKNEVLRRRKKYVPDTSQSATNGVGLALSGGGIRSATFALGVVQQLARRGILKHVDFLSTVSGGGYLGSFITYFLGDQNDRVSLDSKAGNLPFGGPGDRESQAVRHLRNHSKYLTEGGVQTLATIIAMVAYGVLVSTMLVAPLLLAGVLIAKLFWNTEFTRQAAPFPSRYSLLGLAVLGIAVLLIPLAQRLGQLFSLFWQRLCILLGVICAVLLICEALPHLFQISTLNHPLLPLVVAAVFSITLGVIGLWLGPGKLLGRIVFALFGLGGPILIVAAFLSLSYLFMVSWPNSNAWLVGLVVGLFIYSGFILNINFASPHRFYRDRLARTYLTRASQDGAGVTPGASQLLSTMNSEAKAPYQLVNAALNIPASDNPNLRGRNTDFFLFSKHYCGSPIAGFRETTEWEKMDSHLDLGTALAISGAAAAPHMGTLTAPQFTFLLAMLNVRLGYWARNPGRSGFAQLFERFLPPVGWYYFFRELSGWMNEKTHYINLSDGGHIENLGIYELLRRRCKFVIAIDGEADAARSFGGLLKMTQLVKIDLGVRIEPDLADLRVDRDGLGRAHFGLSRLDYPDGTHGLLLYIKSSLTGNESEFLKKYRTDNPDFPHQSTANQFFSEIQFEAYRALGEHIAEDLFRSDLVDHWENNLPVDEWFKRLASRLL